MRTDETPDRDLQGRRFGRKGSFPVTVIAASSTTASDIRLFALTFVSGFLFMTIYLA